MLNQADTIMEQDADSALSILEKIDPNRLSKGDLSYYALLYTQAQVKTDIPLDSDSLISIAYRKYADDWWGDKGIRSNFYMGEVFFNQDNSRDAMKYYLTSYEESKRLDNDYWRAKSAERIADLFFYAFNYEEATKFRKEAIEYFGKAGRMTNQRYAIADLANTYHNMDDDYTAIHLLDSISKVCKLDLPTDTFLRDYIGRSKIDALVSLERANEIDSLGLILLNKDNYQATLIENNILKNQISILNGPNIGYNDELDSLLCSASTEEKGLLLYAIYKKAKADGNKSKALEYVDSLLYLQGEITEQIIKESATGAQRDFYSSIAFHKSREAKLLVIIIISTIFIFLNVVLFIWRTNRLKDKARNAELEANIESFVALKAYSDKLLLEHLLMKEEMEKKNQTVKSLQLEISNIQHNISEFKNSKLSEGNNRDMVMVSLFRDKWTTLNLLCDQYYEYGDSDKMRNHLISNIEKELKKISSKKGLDQIEEATNKYMDNIIFHLRDECIFLNQKDITFVMLIIAGFSAKAVSYIIGIKTGNFYVKKGRIASRINESNVTHKEDFLDFLK